MARVRQLKLSADQIRPLVPNMGGCIASDRITVEGRRVGSMRRDASTRAEDSGWLFLAGDESQAYMDEPDNFTVYSVNSIANYDPDIIPWLYALPGQIFDRDRKTGAFAEAPDSEPDAAAAQLPPGVRVVQGETELPGRWQLELPSPFRRRLEEGSLVLWRPGLTLWITAFSSPDDSAAVLLAKVQTIVSPKALDAKEETTGGLLRFTYRLREEGDAKADSLYGFVFDEGAYAQVAAYFDREDDVAPALALVRGVQRQR